MERSKVSASSERRQRLSVPRVPVLFAVVAVALAGCGTLDTGYDERQFDELEAQFVAEPAILDGPASYMDQLVADNPGAERIRWTRNKICITAPGQERVCTEASAQDELAFDPLPAADSMLYYSKDPGRYFVKFNQNDPPIIYAMYAPGDDSPASFAKERGFRSFRALSGGWSLLGFIPDKAARDAQWSG